MIPEFSVVPIGNRESLSHFVTECLRIVQASGLEHELMPMGTIIPGDMDEVIAVIIYCHRKIANM